jgi:hypothetical protein
LLTIRIISSALVAGYFGKSERARKEHLILMARRRLLQLAAPIKGKNALVGYTGLPLGPLSSNLFLALA